MMKRKLTAREIVAVASLLFGLFFGAGNLIFPVHMGQMAGANSVVAILGFVVTAVGLPLLAIVSMALSRSESLAELSGRVGKHYGIFFTCLLYLTIGPCFAIPRCASTSFTVGMAPLVGEDRQALALLIFSTVFFALVLYFSLRPSGILTHPNTVKDPKKLRDSWNAAYGGSNNSGRVAVLEENMSYTPISMPNSEAQFLETRKFQVSEICRIYRVPPHMVGDLEHATFSNIEHQSISFAVHTIRPWVVRLEQAMNRALFSDKEKGVYYVRFNMDGLMRGDYKSRMEGYAIGRQNGWLSTNDIRDLENMNPVPNEDGGNALLVNGNMVSVRRAMNAARENSAQKGTAEDST